MDPARERFWQEAWAAADLGTARRIPGREKFFALVAYPGSSGFLHLGHLRGVAIADALHRFFRMRGRQVFFPNGTHASGLPAVAFAQRVKDRQPAVLEQLSAHGVAESALGALEDPEAAARFLGESYRRVFRRFGALLDDASYLTTIDPDYRAFIRWQFLRLRDRGALRQGPYFASVCPVCGPVSVDPSETDLSTGGDAEVVRYATVPFPLDDGRVLLAATLRPETIYGATNLWVHPRESLAVWHHGETPFLVSRHAAERLVEQHGGRIGHEVRPEEILGRLVKVPFTHSLVPILASLVVDPAQGTGVVMSVPAHAPADWLALAELTEDDRARIPSVPEIIYVPPEEALTDSERALRKGSGVPAERAVRATGAQRLSDGLPLEQATERLYRLEFTKGKMLVPALGPLSVREARERMASSLEAAGTGFELHEFSKPVICRNNHEVVIRKLPDQWFLHYGDAEWKRSTHELVSRLRVAPEEYRRELPSVIDWYEDRPATRRGRWLGTPLPFDPEWVIEPIADSTFYPAYFVLRRYVSTGRLPTSALTDALFDYVFLGQGPGEPRVDPKLLEELRAEFTYWYPLDLNIGGKEHKRVHFPVFLFTHARLLPPELHPKGLLVYWWLVSPEGSKISKKDIGRKGGAVPPVGEALEEFGADAFRLLYCLAASTSQDIAWDPDLVRQSVDRLEEVERLARGGFPEGDGAAPELDAWLADAMHLAVAAAGEAFEAYDLREAAQQVYVGIPQLLRRYIVRGGGPGAPLQSAVNAWVRLLSPITPHLAEELGSGRFNGLVAAQPFPERELFAPNPVARAREGYLRAIEEDLQGVLRPALARGGAPTEAVFYVAAPWKRPVEKWMRGSTRKGGELIQEVLENARAHPELSAAAAELAGYVQRLAPKIRSEPPPGEIEIDELVALRSFEGYLARRFGFRQVSIHREEEAAELDPMNRRQRARPGRPAFYLAGSGRAVSPGQGRPDRPPGAPS